MGLIHLFGEKPVPKVMDFLMVHNYWDYSIRDISKATKLSYRTLQRIMPNLVKSRLIKKTRTEGKAQMYMINSDSKVVKKLDELVLLDAFDDMEKIARRSRKVAVATS